MESLFALIFMSIQQRLSNCGIRIITMDTGQLRDESPSLTYPAALISFGNPMFSSGGGNYQIGTLPVTIKTITLAISSPANITPQESKEKALSQYDLDNIVFKKLQGWSPAYVIDDVDVLGDITGSLDRQTTATNRSRTDVNIVETTYTLGIEDHNAMVDQQIAAVNSISIGAAFVRDIPDELAEDDLDIMLVDL